MTLPCGCPTGRRITDQAKHTAWHALVLEQGGPAGNVDAVSLQDARGFKTGTSDGETYIDVKARQTGKRASGAQRRRAR
jgi:hypothetical protein